MVRKQRLTAYVTTGLLVGALLACKKKPEAAPEASATPPAATAPATPSAAATPDPVPADTAPAPASTGGSAKLGDVKRYGIDKESKLDEAGVRVVADQLKVFNEADAKTAEVATLPKGLLVFRLVKVDDFQLVEFPSGIGQFSQGWVETKGLSDKPEKVTRSVALSEKKTAFVKPTDGGAPIVDGAAAPTPKPEDAAAPAPADAAAPKPTADKPPPPPPPPPKPQVKKSTDKKKTDDKK